MLETIPILENKIPKKVIDLKLFRKKIKKVPEKILKKKKKKKDLFEKVPEKK